MSSDPRTRTLERVPVAPGPDAVTSLLPKLRAALDGTGPAIAPTPVVGPTVSAEYVHSIVRAVHADDADVPLESDDIALVMPTSGSTGAPRGVLLTAESLSVGTTAANGPTPSTVQWIAALPVTAIGGMNVVVRALATGNDPISVSSIGGAGPFTPEDFHAAVSRGSKHFSDLRVSLVPAQVARLLESQAGIEALQACTMILVGGAATRPAIRERAREHGIHFTTTYGATETAGGCVFDGTAIPGASISVVDGRIQLCGAMVARGYRCDPAASARTFVNGCFLAPDLGALDEAGRLVVIGRADDVVIVNGVNVSPIALEAALASTPQVTSAAVIAIGDEPVLVAFLESSAEAGSVIANARAQALTSLGKAAVPKITRVVESLPYLPHGKVDRRTLADWARDAIHEEN